MRITGLSAESELLKEKWFITAGAGNTLAIPQFFLT